MQQKELIELEVKEIFTTFRSFFTLLIQALSIFTVANITVIGYAVTTQTAGALVIGTLINLLAYGTTIVVDALFLSPVYYRAIALREQLEGESLEFFPIFIATYYRASVPDELKELMKTSDLSEKTRRLHRLFYPTPKRFSKRLCFFGSLATLQLLLTPILVKWFGWKML